MNADPQTPAPPAVLATLLARMRAASPGDAGGDALGAAPRPRGQGAEARSAPRPADPRDRRAVPADHRDLRAVPLDADRVAVFTAAATAAGVIVHHARGTAWLPTVLAVLEKLGARRILLEPADTTAFRAADAEALAAALRAAGREPLVRPDDDTLFEGVDAAVAGVAAAIAETGTLVTASGPQTARGTSLVPPALVLLVDPAQIVGDLLDYFADPGLAAALPANLNLITGPSKTADIEGVLVTGVHGPGHVHGVLRGGGGEPGGPNAPRTPVF